jgi:hypothetical protein
VCNENKQCVINTRIAFLPRAVAFYYYLGFFLRTRIFY